MHKLFTLFIFILFSNHLLAYKTRSLITYFFNQDDICMMKMEMELRKNDYVFEIKKNFSPDWAIYENDTKVGDVSMSHNSSYYHIWEFSFGTDTIKISFNGYNILGNMTISYGEEKYYILDTDKKCHSDCSLVKDFRKNDKPLATGAASSPCGGGNWNFVIKDKKISERLIAVYMFASCIATDVAKFKYE